MLKWAEQESGKGTWPREDYKELLDLLIVSLEGNIKDFKFKMPGANHHARWISKAIYYLKLQLLSKVFTMTEEEVVEVNLITEFIVLYYVCHWFLAPLPASVARHDLEFMTSILKYRVRNPRIAWTVLQSTYRHIWYFIPQLIALTLADRDQRPDI